MTTSSFYGATPREVLTFAYIRLSNDLDGTMQSPESQWSGIVSNAHRFDVPVPPPERVFTDRNLSATDTNVVRFDYQRMLKAIRAVDPTRYEVVVLSFLQDRAYRQPAEWQEFTELLGADNYDGRHIDENGIVDLGYMGVFGVAASYIEVKKTAARTRAGITTSAIAGKGHGPVPYGWTRRYNHDVVGKPVSTTVIVEAEAKVIRDAASRVLAGEHLRAICRDLNVEGVPAPGAGKIRRRHPVTREPIAWAGSEWTMQALRQILVRPANKGIREHTTGKGARKATTLHKGNWPAILTDDVYDTLVAKLTDPSRRTTTSSTAKYELTGIATCGATIEEGQHPRCSDAPHCAHGSCARAWVCNRPVTGMTTQSRKGGGRRAYLAYRCPKGHVEKSMPLTDLIVESEVLNLLSQPEVRASLTTPPDSGVTDALAREAGLLARRDAAADQYALGEIDLATMARVTSGIAAQLAGIRVVVERKQDTAVYSDLLRADDMEALWVSYPIERRRSIIRALFTVTLMPTVGKAFDPTTVIVQLRPMKG